MTNSTGANFAMNGRMRTADADRSEAAVCRAPRPWVVIRQMRHRMTASAAYGLSPTGWLITVTHPCLPQVECWRRDLARQPKKTFQVHGPETGSAKCKL